MELMPAASAASISPITAMRFNQQLAPFNGQSGILVTVHPVVLSASPEAS
jgi:hypothetical protein